MSLCASFAAVAEVVLRCKTTNGVVERRFERDADVVNVSRDHLHVAQLSHRLQLQSLDLTEVPSELFRMKNVKRLWLGINNLCSLPSEIAHMTKLEVLWVRLSKRSAAI
jgi:Leucine-rich repeat (LRR) protein